MLGLSCTGAEVRLPYALVSKCDEQMSEETDRDLVLKIKDFQFVECLDCSETMSF